MKGLLNMGIELLVLFNIIIAILVYAEVGAVWFTFKNPIVVYNNIKVNWFGAWFIAIIINIGSPITSIFYWMCKLCTVGRK